MFEIIWIVTTIIALAVLLLDIRVKLIRGDEVNLLALLGICLTTPVIGLIIIAVIAGEYTLKSEDGKIKIVRSYL